MSSTSLASQVEKKIYDLIINGELEPGSRLNNSSLAKQFSVAVSPVREALSRLSATGLVDFKDNKGFFVACINKETLFDIAETYIEIEAIALKKAMEKGDETWEMQIAAELYRLSKVESGEKVPFATWAECNASFHHALVSGCQSESLMRCRNMLFQQHDRFMRLCYFYGDEKDIQVNHAEHQALAKAVLERDIDKALELQHAHVLCTKKMLLERLQVS